MTHNCENTIEGKPWCMGKEPPEDYNIQFAVVGFAVMSLLALGFVNCAMTGAYRPKLA